MISKQSQCSMTIDFLLFPHTVIQSQTFTLLWPIETPRQCKCFKVTISEFGKSLSFIYLLIKQSVLLFQPGKTQWCTVDYINTPGKFCIYYTQNLKYPLIIAGKPKEELCDMRYVIRTAISHDHIKEQITTVGSHGCIINNNTS